MRLYLVGLGPCAQILDWVKVTDNSITLAYYGPELISSVNSIMMQATGGSM